MKKINYIGVGVILCGIILYMIFTDEIPGYMQALITGILIGIGLSLSGVIKTERNKNK